MLQQQHIGDSKVSEHAAAQDGRLALDPAPSFSGWSGPGQLQHLAFHPHPPCDYSSGSISHSQQQQQHDGVSPHREPYQAATDAAAAAAAAHCSLFAAGALGLRARRKSTSDAAPHHVPYPLAPQRRKSDGGLHGSMLSAQHPLFLAVAAAAADVSSHSHSSGSSPDLQTSVVRDMYLHSDARSTGSVSSQHHHLDPITEGVPVTNFDVTPSGSPGRRVSQQGDQEYQQEQQDLLAMQRELLQLQQMAQQKELQLQQLLLQQQQHNRQSPAGAAPHRRSPTPPSHGSGLPGICVSPRASAFSYKHPAASSSNTSAASGSSSGSGSITHRAATEPPAGHSSGAMGASTQSYSSAYSGRSPGAAAMVMTSSSIGRQSQQQQQQLRQAQLEAANAIAASAAASGSPASPGAPAKVQPVARDITQRLQMQRPAGRGAVGHSLAGAAPDMQHSEIWAAWEGHQLAGSAAHGSLAQLEQQAQGQPQAAVGSNRQHCASSAAADPAAQQQQQQELLPPVGPSAAGVRPRPAPQRSHSVSHLANKSPAPPRVPPSPQQQQAAELRTRRSSCSQITSAPSPRSVLSQGDWARSGEPGNVAHGQQQFERGGSDAGFPKLALRVGVVTESEGDSLWDNCFRGQISPSRSPMTSGQPYGAHQQQGGTDFLSMQEQRLQRDQAQTAAAGLNSLAAEGSLKDTASSRRDADSTQQQQQSAGVKAMAGQLLMPQKVAGSAGVTAAALPPPHPPSHQHNDVPCTPRGHMMLNPQHTAPRSASAVLSSAPGLQLPHLLPQQPVPPRQHAPSARSPCVATRMHVAPLSPAAAAWLGNNSGAFAGHSTCSPILEQGPYGASSNPSSSGSTRVGTASDDRVSPALGGSHLSSSGSTLGFGLSGTGSSISITPGTGGSGSSSARISLSGALPRPAFDHLARSVSMDSSFLQQQQQSGMRSPSPPMAPDATATIHGCSRPLRALSPVVKKAPAGCTTPTVNLSSSRARQHMQQRLQEMQIPKSPSPPPMGAAAMIAANPRGGAHTVQPCPPLHSLPPVSPSPSVRTRVLTQQAGAAAGAGAQAGGVADVPEWAGSSPLVGVPAAAKCALAFSRAPSEVAAPGAAAAVPGALPGARQGSPQELLAVRRPAQLLQLMPAAPQASSGSGTPDLSWMQTAGAARHAPSSGLLQDASAVAAAALAGRAAGPAAAQDSLDWQAAAVVAFSHYRGRLGYLMNSGVVGVKFEDGCTMLMQGEMRCVCYLAPGSAAAVADAAAAARPAGVDASPAGKDKCQLAGGAAVAGAGACSMGRRISTDLGQSDQSAGQHSAQAAAEGTDVQASVASKQGRAVQLFQLPEQLASTPSSSDVAGPSDSSSSGGGGGVPDYLASKVRCMQRFVGCLLHHQPYSSKRHLDVTRLALPGALGLQQQGAAQDQQHEGLQPGLGPSCVHVQHFSYSEGCALLTLTNGSQQLVFISDSSVMLLHPGLRQLGYVTPPRRHKHRSSGAGSNTQDAADAAAAGSCSDSACSGSDSDSSSGEGDTAGPAAGGAQLLVLKLGGVGADAVAGQRDPRLLARLKQASRLPGVLPMPFDL